MDDKYKKKLVAFTQQAHRVAAVADSLDPSQKEKLTRYCGLIEKLVPVIEKGEKKLGDWMRDLDEYQEIIKTVYNRLPADQRPKEPVIEDKKDTVVTPESVGMGAMAEDKANPSPSGPGTSASPTGVST